MRKLLLFILFTIIATATYSQQISNRFVSGRVVHTQVGGSPGVFDVSCNFLDEAGYFDGTNIAIGDKLFVSDGGFGYYLPITQILSSSYTTVVIRVNSTGLPLASVPTGIGYLTRGSPTYQFKPYISGMSSADQQISSEEFMYAIDSLLRFKLVERISGSSAPVYTPTATQSWIAQNGAGDVYKFNGTSWSLVGGLVTTTSPLIGDGTVGNPVTLPNNSIGANQIISSGVAAGTYGSASQIPTFTVDQDGRITAVSVNNVIDGTANNEGILGVANGGGSSAVITSNTSGASGVSILPGTGITLNTLVASNGGGITINAEDASITNEGRLGVGGTGTTTRVINSNTSGNVGVSIVAGTGMSLSATNSSNGGSITFNNTGDLLTTNEGNLSLLPFGLNGGRITSNTSGSGSPKFVGTGNTTITVNNDTMFINTTGGIASVFTTSPITGDGTTGNRIRLDTIGLGDNEYFMVYNGSSWGAGTILTGGGIIGEGTSSNPLQLDDLGATTGQIIKWNGAAWVAANDSTGFNPSTALGGDLSGTLPNPNVVRIQNIPVSTTDPTLNQILKFNGTEYIPAIDTFRWALKAPNGTSATPSYTFDASQGTGLYAVQGTVPRMTLVGASSSSSTRGTGITLVAGLNSSTGQGGAIALTGGNASSGNAGAVSLTGGYSNSGDGGNITLYAGDSNTGNAGQIYLFGGNSFTTTIGGNINLSPGNATTLQGVGKVIINGAGTVHPSYTRADANALLNKQVGQTVYISNDTSSTGKIGGLASWNGTEWLPLYNDPDFSVLAGTDSTSLIYLNPSSSNPLVLKTRDNLNISESGNTITLSSDPDIYEFDSFGDCTQPTITPTIHGPFYAHDINEECNRYYEWDFASASWVFITSSGLNPYRLLFSNFSGVPDAHLSTYTDGSTIYIGTPDSRRTSGREPFVYTGNLIASHVNGNQFCDVKIGAFGTIFDAYNEDRNQNEVYVRTNTTYRVDNTPGNYRSPVVGDLMFNQMAKITRRYQAPYDPNADGSGVTWIDIKTTSVNATTKDVGTEVNFYTRKNTDPQWGSGGGNLVLQLKEDRDIRAANYALRNDSGTPTYIAGFNADGTLRSDLLSEISITETLGIDTDLGGPDGSILNWNGASEEWEAGQLSYHFEEVNYSATTGATNFTLPITPATPTGAKMPIRVYRNGVKLIYSASAPSVHQFTYSAGTLTTSACNAGDIISVEYLNY